MTQTTSTPQVSQTEINSILWRACDTFRGTIDASEYKNYLLVMLFLKYISLAAAASIAQPAGGDFGYLAV